MTEKTKKELIDKKGIKRIIINKMKDNPNYLNEQAQAYADEFALQKTFSIQFFPEEKLELVKEVRDYLYELKEELEK